MKRWSKKLLDGIFPPRCFGCGDMVEDSGGLCSRCWQDVHFISQPYCASCAYPFEYAIGEEGLCGQCIAQPPPYDKARAVFRYEDASSGFITGFKYSDKTYAAPMLAQWLHRVGRELLEEADMMVPVPLHRKRLFQRRYNQAALLCQALGKLSGLPVLPDGLVRVKHNPPQAGLRHKARKRNVQGAFTVAQRSKPGIAGKIIVLVDDVMTTGATVQACSKALKQAGAKQVYVLVLGRTLLQ